MLEFDWLGAAHILLLNVDLPTTKRFHFQDLVIGCK